MAMGDELLEAVTADTIAHEIKRASKHSLPIGAPCPNCNTAIAGPYCYACGQRAEKFNRSVLRLMGEVVEGLIDIDGRIWQTLPRLALNPGRLTRDYLEGHRATQVPPFRIFLIVLLIVFFAGSENFSHTHPNFQIATPDDPVVTANMSPKDKAGFQHAMDQLKTMKDGDFQGIGSGSKQSQTFWVGKIRKAAANPNAFFASALNWAHQLAVVMLPIAALMLSVLFVFKKNVYVFDHLIFSMHSLSFQGLLLSAAFLGAIFSDAAWYLLWLSPAHLFFHMRGTYRVSVIGTLLRMSVLFLVSSIVFGLMIAALVMIGLATVQ
ncbi:MAG TPA: DUF3667 domain-containing protein [Phenylobacterium sp.]|jgi:hypothetical protein|uniref:DUF3667 domain-containing protein n=1 Tax=Phenylobacterium sp. TaxID=1871053 RepID=UPI002D2A4961|nr:DUF3667 domain-containing protein [Phenylobacterium sp.]HZZ70600.1 DUF3667 domain-containing protein [Phenylobacterium sp.]